MLSSRGHLLLAIGHDGAAVAASGSLRRVAVFYRVSLKQAFRTGDIEQPPRCAGRVTQDEGTAIGCQSSTRLHQNVERRRVHECDF